MIGFNVKNDHMSKKFDLLLLSIFLIVLNTWFILIPYGFSHDTSFIFEVFYFFYNHFYLHHQLAQWMPYYSFGIPAHLWQLASLSVVQYFIIAIGSLLKITNVLLMFKISLVLEQLVFLVGMFLLSNNLFKRRSSVLLVCLASTTSLFSIHELFFDFRIYYLLPLTLYFLIRFIKENRPDLFWISGIIFLAWWLGNASYMIFVCIPLLVFITISFAAIHKGFGNFKCLLKMSFKNILLFVIFGIISFCIFDIHHVILKCEAILLL